jgi:hypothetical protein
VKVRSDIGAMEPGRWHVSHFAWKTGATCLVNVGFCGASAEAGAGASQTSPNPTASVPSPLQSIVRIAQLLSDECTPC